MLAMTSHAEVCTLNCFLYGHDWWYHSIDCLFIMGHHDETRFHHPVIVFDRKASPSFSQHWRSSAQMCFGAVLYWVVSIFCSQVAETVVFHSLLWHTVYFLWCGGHPTSEHQSCLWSLLLLLQAMSPVFFLLLLKQQTQCLTELTSVASSLYPIFRHLWISTWLEAFTVGKLVTSLCLSMDVQNICYCVLNARDWLEHPWSW